MSNRTRSLRAALATALGAAVLIAVGATPAQAAYGIDDFSVDTTTNQAGGHPDLTVDLKFARESPSDPDGNPVNDGLTREIVVDTPAGVTGNPENVTPCRQEDFDGAGCPAESQVGVLEAKIEAFNEDVLTAGVWVVQPRNPNETARLVTSLFNSIKVNIVFNARSDGDLGLRTVASGLPASDFSPWSVRLSLWGYPADSSHDFLRFGRGIPNTQGPLKTPVPLNIPRRPFVSNPTSCGPQAPATAVSRSFADEEARATATPVAPITGCALEPFAPAFSFRALTPQADAPSAFDAKLDVPGQADLAAPDASHVRRLDATLPPGVAVSPPAAATLGACSDADLKVGTLLDATCPESSRLGDASIDVPILRQPLQGGVYLRQPTPGHLFRLAIVTSGVGVKLKLLGEAFPDPVTGQLRAVFDDAPQQPVRSVALRFKGGPRAPLATPQACTGSAATAGSVLGWNGALISVADSFPISSGPGGSGCPDGRTFTPSIRAGTTGVAGGRGTFSFQLTRPDGQPNLGSLRLALAPGLLGRIDTITPCSPAAAAVGACPAPSRIGSTTVGAGSGASPLYVGGPVYLTGPYKGAPFGLSIVVPTAGQAGPFDLGNVTVRAALSIDPRTTQVTVDTDPLPTILQGVPLRLRDVRVGIDRPKFIVNPTDCSRKATNTRVFAVGGATALRSSPFQVSECASLAYEPKLGLRLTGKGETRDGRHPGLLARLRPRSADANTKSARVVLPSGLALDPENARALCEPSAAARNACPKGSIVGRASARSILHQPVRGNVYFVRGERKDKRTGRTIRTLPKLYIPLSGEGVRIDVRADSAVSKGRLVAAFNGLPDVPLKSFDLRLNGGANGIIAVSGTNICTGTRRADARLGAHNGRSASNQITLSRPCR